MRQIDRENQILLNKILCQRPMKKDLKTTNTSEISKLCACRKSSAAINREHRQVKIDYDNNILRQKLEKIAKRNIN